MSGAKMETAGIGGLAARARAVVAASAWSGLAGKAGLYLAGFVALALVGSGRMSTWLSPPGRMTMGVAVAAAATAPPGSAAPPASAAPVVAVAAGIGAGVEAGAAVVDAGAAPEGADAGAGSAGIAPDGKVILNLAVEEDLRHLPGIGPTRARAILALRGRLKRFGRIEDLLKVKGLGRRSLARLRPLVRLD